MRSALLLACVACGGSAEGRWEGATDVVVYGRPMPFDFDLSVDQDTSGQMLVRGEVAGEGQVHRVEGWGPWRERRVDVKLEPPDTSGVTAAVAFTLDVKLRGGDLRGTVEVLKIIDRFDEAIVLERIE